MTPLIVTPRLETTLEGRRTIATPPEGMRGKELAYYILRSGQLLNNDVVGYKRDSFRMSVWMEDKDCGTAYCMAGWAAILPSELGSQKVDPEEYDPSEFLSFKGRVIHVRHIAATVLDLDREESDFVFLASYATIEEALEQVYGPEGTPDIRESDLRPLAPLAGARTSDDLPLPDTYSGCEVVLVGRRSAVVGTASRGLYISVDYVP